MTAIVLLSTYLILSNISAFGGVHSYVVQSGSMEPSIMIGDVVLAKSQQSYLQNDVISFHDSLEGRIVTHRIIKTLNNGQEFITKGDANQAEDDGALPINMIIGKVKFVIPKIGFLVAFTKTLKGLIILVLIPAFIFILDEFVKIKKNAK